MNKNVYGHVFYQNKTISDLLSLNAGRLRDFVDAETLGVWGIRGDEIIYRDNFTNDHLHAKDIGLSLVNLIKLLSRKCVFCDGNVAIVDGDEVIYIKIQKSDVCAQYGDLTDFPNSI